MLQKCNILETSTYFTHFSGFVNPPSIKSGCAVEENIEKSPIYG